MHKKYMKMSVGDYFYKGIKELSSEIGRIGLSQDFINFKNEEDPKYKRIRAFYLKVKLKILHFMMWIRIATLYKDYVEYGQPTIFLNDETNKHYYLEKYKKLFKYDPDEIDPINLWVLFMFSDLKMRETSLFVKGREFQEILKEKGYPELAEYLDEYCIDFDGCIEQL